MLPRLTNLAQTPKPATGVANTAQSPDPVAAPGGGEKTKAKKQRSPFVRTVRNMAIIATVCATALAGFGLISGAGLVGSGILAGWGTMIVMPIVVTGGLVFRFTMETVGKRHADGTKLGLIAGSVLTTGLAGALGMVSFQQSLQPKHNPDDFNPKSDYVPHVPGNVTAKANAAFGDLRHEGADKTPTITLKHAATSPAKTAASLRH